MESIRNGLAQLHAPTQLHGNPRTAAAAATTTATAECFYVFRKLEELETWFGEVGLPAGDQGMGGAGPGA